MYLIQNYTHFVKKILKEEKKLNKKFRKNKACYYSKLMILKILKITKFKGQIVLNSQKNQENNLILNMLRKSLK